MFHPTTRFVTWQTSLLALTIFVVFAGTTSGQTIVGNIPISGIVDGNGVSGIAKVAVNPTTNRAYVVTTHFNFDGGYTDNHRRTIQVVDLATLAVIASIESDGEISKIVVNPSTNRVYALKADYANRVMVIDGDTNQLLTVINVPADPLELVAVNEDARDLAVNPVTNRIYGIQTSYSRTTSEVQLRAFVIDGATNSVIGVTPYFPRHYGMQIVVNPVTNRFYVLDSGDAMLLVFNGDTNSLETTLSDAALGNLGGVQMAINPDAGKLYILAYRPWVPSPYSAVLAVVDTNTNELHSILDIGNSRQVKDIAVNPTTNRVYVMHGPYGPYYPDPWPYYVLSEFDGNTNSITSRTIFSNNANYVDVLSIAVNSQTNRLFINRFKFLSVFDPVDTTTPSLAASDLTVEATSPNGAPANYSTSGSDNSNVSPAIACSIPSGSLFPIGTTTVTCIAQDNAGNASTPQTFSVNVVDTAPQLSLPPYISTSATSSAGAQVAYFASADDAVSGQLPVQCSPTSGSTFSVGVTAVNCSVTDGAGNTATGSFNIYVLAADQTYTPPDSYYVTVQPTNGPTLTFSYVEGAGVTTVTPIDAATVGTTPAGFALSNGIAYQVSTTATFYDYVQLDFAVPAPISESDFNNLSILHNNNGTLEDVTGGHNYDAQSQSGTITAYTYSFSPFYLVKKVNLRIAPLFDQSQAFKAGSTVPIKLKLLDGAGTNIAAPTTALKARSLVRLGTSTTSTVIDAGNANPDLNFRYDQSLKGYIFNLSTKGLASGQYVLSFYVGSERSFFYTVKFEVR